MEHQRALPVGTRIEEYRLETVLGAGGFGITYRAHDTHLAKTVAIKEYLPAELATRTADSTVVPNSDADTDDYQWGLARFLDEARTLARFDHPHLNKVYRFFEAHGTAYLVLDYVEGEPLSARLRQQKTLPAEELDRLLTDVLSGLEAVHAAGYVHRDVKPGNLMVRPDGSTVLLDFGAARQAIGQRSKSVTAILTPGYAPIEQYDSKAEDVGPWSDLYALGMVAYRCVSGVSDAELPDAVTRARKGDAEFPSAVEVGKGRYPHKLLAAIDHAIQVKETARPQSVAAWQAEVSSKQESPAPPMPDTAVAPEQRPSPASAPSGRTIPRKLGLRVLGAVWIIALLALGGTYWFSRQADIAAYRRATEANTTVAYAEYLAAYPTGRHAQEARDRAQFDAQDTEGRTALMRAALRGDTESVQTLLAGGAQPDVPGKDGGTALMAAAYKGHTASVEALLGGGAQPDVQDEDGGTALMWAAYKGHTASVEALLAGGAQPNVQDENGGTALMAAAGEGDTASVEAILAAGAQPDVQAEGGWTALKSAAIRGHTASVEALLAGGAQPDIQDKDGGTALITAAMHGHTASVEALLAGGAQPNVQGGILGFTALIAAAGEGDTASVEALLAAGAQPNMKAGILGVTALMQAAGQGDTASVEALLTAGAQPNVQADTGDTALMWAASEGHTASVEALLAGGARPDVQNLLGKTALDRARSEGHSEIVRLLQTAGGRSGRGW